MIRNLTEIPGKLLELGKDKILLRNCRGDGWHSVSARDFYDAVENVAQKLISLGVKKNDKVAILSENCCQWIISDFAIMTCGAITVPIFPTLPSDQLKFILKHSEVKGIFLSNVKQFKKIESLRSPVTEIKWIVTFEKIDSSSNWCWNLEQFIEDGRKQRNEVIDELEKRRSSIQPDDIASIIYTSGTTGIPKGVMLTQRNFLSNIEATVDLVEFGSEDVGLSFLPLSHVFERLTDYGYLYKGATIAFSSVERLMKDFGKVKPTIAASVPRVFEAMQEKILFRLQSSSRVKKALFHWGLEIGQKRGNFLLERKDPPLYLKVLFLVARLIVFSKVHRSLGGQLRFFISGGGPLFPETAKFFFSMGITICEGYGLTETSPVISVNTPNDLRFGTVGKIIEGVQVKISEEGEILVKGPNVMKGYYKDKVGTEKTFSKGWFCTGDIGEIVDGYLIIKERKKDIIVTASGENISPQRIENFLKMSPLINNAVVFGDSMDYISALIVPNFEILAKEVLRLGIKLTSDAKVLQAEKVIDLFKKEIFTATKPLANYEKVRKFVLLNEEFSIEKGEITPTMKVKRKVIFDKYRDMIDSMYQKAHGNDNSNILL